MQPNEGLPGGTGAEREQRPPDNVTVGFLYRPHLIVNEAHLTVSERELTHRFTQFFSPGDNNILLLEESIRDPDRNERFQQAYTQHKSFRKAQLVTGSKRAIPDLDSFIPVFESLIFDNPGQSPDKAQSAYLWLVFKVLDQLAEQGYAITLVPEEGAGQPSEKVSKNLPYRKYKQALTKFAKHGLARDKDVAQQTTTLVEQAEKQAGQTHIAGLFGNNHGNISALLPDRIRAVTTTHRDALTDGISNAPRNRIITGIKEGKRVPEMLWLRDYYSEKPLVKNINRILSKVKRPAR